MKLSLLLSRFAICFALLLSGANSLRAQQEKSEQPKEDEIRGAPAEPDDAEGVRAQIAAVEKLLPTFVDRGAALYFLAAARIHLGEPREAMELLNQCMALEEGFDPSGGSEFAGLRAEHSFSEMTDRAKMRFRTVAQARGALVTEDKDLIPEGLAWDPRRGVFYLSSLHRRKIVQI